jgi:hypothetical protein
MKSESIPAVPTQTPPIALPTYEQIANRILALDRETTELRKLARFIARTNPQAAISFRDRNSQSQPTC